MRLPFLPLVGFEQDFLFFTSWAEYLANHSLATIYDDPTKLSVQFINYPPLYLYALMAMARIHHLFFSGTVETTIFLVMIKLSAVVFELLGGWALYRWVGRTQGESWGRTAFALYFLNPAIFYVSVYYGQVDAIFAAFLLFSLIAFLEGRNVWSGFFLACSLLMKLQAIPFIPLFFFFPLIRREWRSLAMMIAGFACAMLIVNLPFILTERVDVMIQRCVTESIAWGKFVSVGAFNLWYLHADPSTLDQNIWGWLYGSDGMLAANGLTAMLTYAKLGVGLFGLAYLWTLACLWKSAEEEDLWLAAAHVALAFYMLPTKVHERYLFPFFILYIPLALQHPVRRMIFYGFSVTYLVNVMVICPLFGETKVVTEIDSTAGVLAAVTNLVLYALFLVYEAALVWNRDVRMPLLRKTLSTAAMAALFLFLLRVYERQPDRTVLYLSQLQPVSVQQTWPPMEVNAPSLAYSQVGRDLSSGDMVMVGDISQMIRRTLRLGDTYYRYGLGAHSVSSIEYEVPEEYDYFECYAGVDAEVKAAHELTPHAATVTFAVYTNGEKKYQSPLMIPACSPERIFVPLPKKQGPVRLRLEVGHADSDPGNPSHSDHADWALAKVVKEAE